MEKTGALYYPHISFTDPAWLKGQALIYDQIYRIIPRGVLPDDSRELEPLLADRTIGLSIDPAVYAQAASAEFLEGLEDWSAAALSRQDSERSKIRRIHSDKTDAQVRRLFSEIGFEDKFGWLHVPTDLASNYMLYLARCIAKENNLDLITNNWAPWTATSYFELNGGVSEFLLPVGTPFAEATDIYSLFSLIVSATTPINISQIPVDKIMEFRQKRAPEIANLRNALSGLRDELQKLTSPIVREGVIRKRISEFNEAQKDYQRSADIIKAKGWFGVSFMGFTAPTALAQVFGIPAQQTAVLTGTALALGGIFTLQNTRSELLKLRQNNPTSCLVELRSDFKKYTRARGGGDMNFHAYNCMEEYVND